MTKKCFSQEKMKEETENVRKSEWEKGKNGNIKKEIKQEKSVGVREYGVRVERSREREGRVEWLLIRVNDVENPPIRAFSCVTG